MTFVEISLNTECKLCRGIILEGCKKQWYFGCFWRNISDGSEKVQFPTDWWIDLQIDWPIQLRPVCCKQSAILVFCPIFNLYSFCRCKILNQSTLVECAFRCTLRYAVQCAFQCSVQYTVQCNIQCSAVCHTGLSYIVLVSHCFVEKQRTVQCSPVAWGKTIFIRAVA